MRVFVGTEEELDSDLQMVWHFLSDLEKREDEVGRSAYFLKRDIRKEQVERKHKKDGQFS